MLISCGVDYVGFPLRLTVHREDLTEREAASVIRNLPGRVTPVLITYLDQAEGIINLGKYLGVKTIQLHGAIPEKELIRLRNLMPDWQLIKSLIIGRQTVVDLLKTVSIYQTHVSAFITDTFDPVSGATGATGITHDWKISRKIVDYSTQPVILAGGLTPENVAGAIAEVHPAGVDAHTGVENIKGRKDREKVTAFLQAARQAFSELSQRSPSAGKRSDNISG